jgi:NADH-quinone oxidoreductase E subunit
MSCGEEKIKEETLKILENYPKEKDRLIGVLNDVQERFGYVPREAQEEISKYLGLSLAEIYGVITFYSRFTLEPKGKYKISVCLGTACFVKGSQAILDRVKERLKIEPGKTTPDGMFSLDDVRCVGACGLAPVFMINDEVYGNATVKQLDEVIDKILAENN